MSGDGNRQGSISSTYRPESLTGTPTANSPSPPPQATTNFPASFRAQQVNSAARHGSYVQPQQAQVTRSVSTTYAGLPELGAMNPGVGVDAPQRAATIGTAGVPPTYQPAPHPQQPQMSYNVGGGYAAGAPNNVGYDPNNPPLPAYTPGHGQLPPQQQQQYGATPTPQINIIHAGVNLEQSFPALPLTLLGPGPGMVTCPMCKQMMVTAVTYQAGNNTHIWAVVSFLFLCAPCIPYLMDSTKDVQHTCSRCGVLLATHIKGGHTQVHVVSPMY